MRSLLLAIFLCCFLLPASAGEETLDPAIKQLIEKLAKDVETAERKVEEATQRYRESVKKAADSTIVKARLTLPMVSGTT